MRETLAPEKLDETMLQLPPDLTFYLEIAAFLVFAAILTRVILRPTLNVLAERERRTHGAEAEAERLKGESAAMQARLEQRLDEARRLGADEGETIRRSAEKKQADLQEAAAADAARTLSEMRDRIRAESATARQQLRGETDRLARTAVERLLERPLS